ncbi:hypothetical protein BKA93DRAFT_821791 [Sparassis latifolia]|uniref:CFEM domain-containing protein n=1 Tax=Sparassis crispa TaxID=139825 RepID=A0A401GMQ4_9APHY|nr:hypothetical protein SCP_0505460 [Sparassis crispa]GBE83495.1 hypothetical protein SCP_0505460 [Sparassis crispa]
MRFAALLALSGAIASVSAGTILRRQFPSCATPCLANANFGSCNESDDTCLCNSSQFVDSVTTCIMSSCNGSDLTTAEQDAQQLCLAVGVTLTATPSGSATGSATPSATAPSSSSAASASSSAHSSSSASSSASSSSSAPSATHSSGALSHGVPALAALAAVGAVAFAL